MTERLGKKAVLWSLGLVLATAPANGATLLAAWEFNAGDVSGSDVSASGGSAGNTTGILQGDASAAGGTLSLDGVGDYLQFGSNLTDLRQPTGMTVAAWVNADSAVSSIRRIVEHEDNFYFWAESSAFKYTTHGTLGGDPDSRAVSTTAPAVGQWQHVLVTFESGQPADIYVNGVYEGTSANNQAVIPGNTETFQIGARRSGGTASQSWDGLIDDVGIWDAPLSLQEIQLLAGVGTGGYPGRVPPSGLDRLVLSVAASGDNLIFTWNTRVGKVYDLLSATTLDTPPSAPWPPYDNGVDPVYENIAADPSGTNTQIVPRPGDATRFFALREEEVVLAEPVMDMQELYGSDRFPNVVTATDGTILATWGRTSLLVRRSEDGGETWGAPITVGPGIQGGGTTVDETSGDILAFVETEHPPAPLTVYRSTDHGLTWQAQTTTINPDVNGNVPSMSMAEHGIALSRGSHPGRLLRPARWYDEGNGTEFYPEHYNTAIYSDDGGYTWNTSDPFPANGTGEGAVAELSDGTVYYNSRRHWAPEGVNPRQRWTAESLDAGETWANLTMSEILPDGEQNRDYGLMGGLVRLPVEGRDILVFSNIESPSGRTNGILWTSFDGGQTWPLKRRLYGGAFAYSSLVAGRPGTAGDGWIYAFFEGGPSGAGTMARFNLPWLLEGEMTGDGSVPEWVSKQNRGTLTPESTTMKEPPMWIARTAFASGDKRK